MKPDCIGGRRPIFFMVGNKLESNKSFKGFRKKRKMRNWSVIETSIWIQIGFLGWEKQLCIDQAPVKKLVPVTSLLWAPGLSSYRNKNAQENIFRFFLKEAFISSTKFLMTFFSLSLIFASARYKFT